MLHVASPLHFYLRHWPDGGKHRTTTDDLENRENNAAEIHGVHLKWAYGAAQIPELKELFDRDYRNIILDLRDVRLADRDAVRFLQGCEAEGMKLENCPAYDREWMDREKN
jgi:hypothetical protein